MNAVAPTPPPPRDLDPYEFGRPVMQSAPTPPLPDPLPAPKRHVSFVEHDPLTGEITRWGSAPEGDVRSTGGVIVEGAGAPSTHHIVGGQLVAYTPAQATTKAARPSPWYRWSNQILGWEETRTLAEIAAAAGAGARTQRDRLLATSDFTQLADAPAAKKSDWAAYRAALRDVPQQPGFPDAVVWPATPV